MNHLHFVQSLEPLEGGGLGTAALGLHLAMQGAGCGSQLVATRGPAFESDWPGVRQYVRAAPQKFFRCPALAAEACGLVERSDVVHGHGLYVDTNRVLGEEARRQGKPLVYHAHGFFEPWILSRSRLRKRFVHFLFEDANFRSVTFWRALTHKEADQIRQIAPGKPVEVIPNGVSFAKATPVALPELYQKHRPRRLLFLGRLHPKKGLPLLLAAWARLVPTFTDWELVIVGPDEAGHAAEVRAEIARLCLSGSVRVLPAVSGAVKEAVLASAELFVLPSYSEGFPMAVLEAASFAIPVVLTDACNFPELAEAGAAWQCQAEPSSLEAALRVAFGCSATERQQRGEAGRALVASRYAWDTVARQLDAACQHHAGHSSQPA